MGYLTVEERERSKVVLSEVFVESDLVVESPAVPMTKNGETLLIFGEQSSVENFLNGMSTLLGKGDDRYFWSGVKPLNDTQVLLSMLEKNPSKRLPQTRVDPKTFYFGPFALLIDSSPAVLSLDCPNTEWFDNSHIKCGGPDSMSEEDLNFFVAGLLGALKEKENAEPKSIRKWDDRGSSDAETRANVTAYRNRLQNLQAFSSKKPLPPCPKCGSKLILERELAEEYRLVCFSGRHSIEVVRKIGNIFWVPAHFFQKDE